MAGKTIGATALCLGLLLTGCAEGDGAKAPSGGGEPVGSQTSGAGVGSQTSGARVQERDTKTLVEQTVSSPGAPEDKVTIGVQSLTVEDKTMVLRLVLTPDFRSVSDNEPVELRDAARVGSQFFGVDLRLLDRKNLKEYGVVNSRENSLVRWWASGSGDVSSVNGEPMYAFAVFAAPEDDIDSIDVRVNEQWPEFTDVPITR